MDHGDFMASIAAFVRPQVYVELGLDNGSTFNKMLPHVTKGHGVDMRQNAKLQEVINGHGTKVTTHYCTTDDFFLNFKQKIDMAFIDADHKWTSALNDFEHTLSLLSDNGIIFIHDVDPYDDMHMNPGLCHDSYKLVPLLEKRTDINVVVLPLTVAGIAIVTKKNSTRTFLRHGSKIYQ